MGKNEEAVEQPKKKKSKLKIVLIIVLVLFVLFVLFALLSDDETDTTADYSDGEEQYAEGYEDYEDYDEEDTTSTSVAQAESNSDDGGAEYVVLDPVGSYRSFKSKMADSYSEEINELAKGKHFVDESFDFTEYATTINESHEGTWGIYIYMCGSNLESEGGAATEDINEMFQASIPDGCNVVIQTGGANGWYNEMVDPNYTQRLLFDGNDVYVVDSQPLSNMGEQSTLEDFLTFCNTNYDADNKMVIFWNHGGASIGGACYDELFNDDHLTLNEIDAAFTNVYGKERIEAVGFDCCLMATVDTANSLRNHAKMLVASEELEPGNGWYYTGWLNALASDPSMSNAELGKNICDSFIEGCEMYGTDGEATLSVIDLNRINLVTASVNALGVELLGRATENPEVVTKFARAAQGSENYGGNNDSSGYFDMVDLGDLLSNSQEVFPDSIDYANYALSKAVVYNVHGAYRSQSTGLSIFYPYDKTEANQQKFEAVTSSDIYASAVRYTVTGNFSQESADLITIYQGKVSELYEEEQTTETENETPNAAATTRSKVSTDTLNDSNNRLEFTNDGKDLVITVDDEGYATTSVGKSIDAIESVTCSVLFFDEKKDTFISLGTDNDVSVDWEKGEIKDNFRGVWASLGGHYLYLDIVYEGEDYNLYSVPVKVNGKAMDMSVSYDYNTESYNILGLSDSVETTGANNFASKSSEKLKAGDKITIINYVYDEKAEDWVEIEYDSFDYAESMKVVEETLPDGLYVIMFETVDLSGNEVFSEFAYIDYANGEMTTYSEADLED